MCHCLIRVYRRHLTPFLVPAEGAVPAGGCHSARSSAWQPARRQSGAGRGSDLLQPCQQVSALCKHAALVTLMGLKMQVSTLHPLFVCRFVLYLSTPAKAGPSARSKLSAAVATLTRPQAEGDTDKPHALLTLYYSQQLAVDPAVAPSNVACCEPPDCHLSVDRAVTAAEASLQKLYPESNMLHGPASAEDEQSDEEALEALNYALQDLQQTEHKIVAQ